jgi:hypothetical protein
MQEVSTIENFDGADGFFGHAEFWVGDLSRQEVEVLGNRGNSRFYEVLAT